jgi:hypothetical protein
VFSFLPLGVVPLGFVEAEPVRQITHAFTFPEIIMSSALTADAALAHAHTFPPMASTIEMTVVPSVNIEHSHTFPALGLAAVMVADVTMSASPQFTPIGMSSALTVSSSMSASPVFSVLGMSSAMVAANPMFIEQTFDSGTLIRNYVPRSSLKGAPPYSVTAGSVTATSVDAAQADPYGGTGARRITVTANTQLRFGSTTFSPGRSTTYRGGVWIRRADTSSPATVNFDINDTGPVSPQVTDVWTLVQTVGNNVLPFRFMDIFFPTAGDYHLFGMMLDMGTTPISLSNYLNNDSDAARISGSVGGLGITASMTVDVALSHSHTFPAMGLVAVMTVDVALSAAHTFGDLQGPASLTAPRRRVVLQAPRTLVA